ncbi:RidA family protein [Ralstonia solanacearum]|uniref:RidA family protein n=1 Tax=Ralstonia solanacearum K60 TaxID=1091042 RepID=A0AAP8D2S1_RALSL|nr:RidA family protein [Ralstonia solanacearum]MBT1539004.1 RidA family protein [Ralstonia solanacearum]OYQ10029.1 RidA family protein [Ralstonia solanacearum K60]QOK84757.1 RidA family protein [Ralstonia solanacearum]RIJ83929.1 RidA family protein [Ralstonia solanacearum]
MSGVRYVNAPTLRAPAGHYSHAVCANGFVFVAGQIPVTPDGRKLVDASFEEQVRQVLHNLDAVLAASGTDRARLVQVRVYVTDMETHWPAFDALYRAWIGEVRPARAVVPVPTLHYGLAVEIEATALAGD